MQYYSNRDRTKLIATNSHICSVITISTICQNVCTYTIPYIKKEEEQLEEIEESVFKEAYDCVTAFMADMFIQTKGKGINALLTDATKNLTMSIRKLNNEININNVCECGGHYRYISFNNLQCTKCGKRMNNI